MHKIEELRNLGLQKLGHPVSLGNIDAQNLKLYVPDNVWLILVELTAHLALNYIVDGSFKIKIWQLHKHVKTLLLLKDLSVRLWEILIKSSKESKEN